MQELYSGSVRVAPLRKAQPAKIRFQRAVMLVRHDRLIGEVKRACNLTIKIGQEARGRPDWHLGVTFRNAVSQGKILNGPCQVFKSPSGRLLLELIQPTLAGLRSTK